MSQSIAMDEEHTQRIRSQMVDMKAAARRADQASIDVVWCAMSRVCMHV